jgi:hypothetical protein
LWVHERPNLFDAERWHATVENGMTVWTYWPQVLNRIDLILAANFGKGAEVMYVDEPLGHRPVDGSEREPTDDARGTMSGDAELPRAWVALVSVDRDLIPRSFDHRLGAVEFVGKRIYFLPKRAARGVTWSRQCGAECRLDILQNCGREGAFERRRPLEGRGGLDICLVCVAYRSR